METELLPCPFCGGKAMLFDFDTETDAWRVSCVSHDIDCQGQTWSRHGPEAAIAAWNKRTPPPQAAPNAFIEEIKVLIEAASESGMQASDELIAWVNTPQAQPQAAPVEALRVVLYGETATNDAMDYDIAFGIADKWLQGQPLPQVQPNWQDAPEWANWHTVDEDGRAYWWNTMPRPNVETGEWLAAPYVGVTKAEPDTSHYANWRTTLQQRPTAGEGAQ